MQAGGSHKSPTAGGLLYKFLNALDWVGYFFSQERQEACMCLGKLMMRQAH